MRKNYFSTSARPALPLYNAAGLRLRSCWLNFGPQHPAAHGIVRLNLQIHGEVLCRVDPQFGLLHRGTEKLVETRTITQSLPYFDRFDYVANLFQEHAYCLAVEALGSPAAPQLAHIATVRLFFDEFSRVLNHLLTLSATSLDLSAMGPIFWAFEERERIMELFERVSGARMHTALYAPHHYDFSTLTTRFWLDCVSFLNKASRALSGAFLGLLHNRALKSRLGGVGQLSPMKLRAYGITGVIGRSSGILTDLRLHPARTYSAYRALSFRTFVGRRGDNFDRFLLRVKEVIEAFRLISQAVSILRPNLCSGLPASPLKNPAQTCRIWGAPLIFTSRKKTLHALLGGGGPNTYVGASFRGPLFTPTYLFWGNSQPFSPARAQGTFSGMEELISHFRQASEGCLLEPGFSYAAVEAPKGELGAALFTDGTPRPYRLKVRTPVAHNLHLIPSLGSGVFFADFVASFCSLDVVFGEIDR
jgi:NADH-quinone oxidoreductase subunit D